MGQRYYCKYCGQSFSSLENLQTKDCPRHPDGFHEGKHCLYKGTQKKEYSCKYCNATAESIPALTVKLCSKHPKGFLSGQHEPIED